MRPLLRHRGDLGEVRASQSGSGLDQTRLRHRTRGPPWSPSRVSARRPCEYRCWSSVLELGADSYVEKGGERSLLIAAVRRAAHGDPVTV